MTSKEDLGDFPSEYKKKNQKNLVGARRAESTKQFTARSGITTKIPPFFMGQHPGLTRS